MEPSRTDRMSTARAALPTVAALLFCASAALAAPNGSSTAREALVLCNRADGLSGDEREEALARGMELAERAVAADARDGLAHFATVCNLGRQMQSGGMGFGQLLKLRRLRRELDTTLEIAPNDADALVAKGALLLRLPRLLGGDRAEAEKLLLRALAAEPDNGTARCYLAYVLNARDEGSDSPHC